MKIIAQNITEGINNSANEQTCMKEIEMDRNCGVLKTCWPNRFLEFIFGV